MPLFTPRSPERTNIRQWTTCTLHDSDLEWKAETENQTRARQIADMPRKRWKLWLSKWFCPPSPRVTTFQSLWESGRGLAARGESVPSELSASVLDSLSSLFQVKWEAADKPNEALWKETVSKTAGFALDWMSCARRLIWHHAEVPQLTKHVTQPVRMKAGNVEKLSADGHLGCSSVLLLKTHWKTHTEDIHVLCCCTRGPRAAGARPMWGG